MWFERIAVAVLVASSASRWIDATATLDPATTPVYEGDAPMSFEFLHDMRKGEGFTLSKLTLGAHSGTHVDAPMHFIRDGAPIDQVDGCGPRRFIATSRTSHSPRQRNPNRRGLVLERVQAGDYDLIVLPMKVGGHEAAPARAVLRKR